ncbi:sensor histidine kinase [Paenibacillus flagellatus]|uniref:sensor histidine kinase n=1 Tax=Paenibacillus flagellatus TaxID=2211139 RepID=UPI0013054582|nr:sensor histidine kinase [Paenibacillus flagellatus]
MIRYKLRVQMVLFNVMIAVVPIIFIGFVSYSAHYHTMKRSISDSVDILFAQTNGRIEQYFDEINAVSRSVFLNKGLQQTLLSERDEWVQFGWLRNHFSAYLEVNASIQGLYWIKPNESVFSTASLMTDDELRRVIGQLDPARLSSGELIFSGPIVQNGKLLDYYLAVRTVKSVIPANYLQGIGIGVIVLDRSRLDEIVGDSHLDANWQIYVADHRNRIIASTDPGKPGQTLADELLAVRDGGELLDIDGVSSMVKASPVNKAGWKLVAAIPADLLFAEGRVLKTYISLIVVIVFAIAVVMALFFNIVITRPINELIDAFARVASGDWKSKVWFSKKNEVTLMAVHFNKMVREIRSLTERQANIQQKLYEAELQKKQFELNGLQAQINAHFLYNTLHSLRGMAMSRSADAMASLSGMIGNLVAYFRYCSRTDEYGTVGAELQHLETYLAIQKERFGKRLKIVVDADERLRSQRILKLLIQPLVENALFHGIENKDGNGLIRVAVYRQGGDAVVIKVLDNGDGIGKAKAERLSRALSAPEESGAEEHSPEDKRSIGLLNIHKRIRLYYGQEYGLSIKSWERIGTAVLMKLPYDKEAI